VVRGRLKYKLPGASSAVLAVREVVRHPQVVSTSRHITQGLIDLSGETWKGGELSGVSKVVAGDPYEVRIAPGGWVAESVAGGVIVSRDQVVRVKLDAGSGDVRWSVRFREK
jgi:hypothetical protein